MFIKLNVYIFSYRWKGSNTLIFVVHWIIKFVSDLRQVGGFLCMGTPVSSTNKTDRHNIAEILLKVALKTISLTLIVHSKYYLRNRSSEWKLCFLPAIFHFTRTKYQTIYLLNMQNRSYFLIIICIFFTSFRIYISIIFCERI